MPYRPRFFKRSRMWWRATSASRAANDRLPSQRFIKAARYAAESTYRRGAHARRTPSSSARPRSGSSSDRPCRPACDRTRRSPSSGPKIKWPAPSTVTATAGDEPRLRARVGVDRRARHSLAGRPRFARGFGRRKRRARASLQSVRGLRSPWASAQSAPRNATRSARSVSVKPIAKRAS